jgi:hypothetical protein
MAYIPGLGGNMGMIIMSLILIAPILWLTWKLQPLLWQWLSSGSARMPAVHGVEPVHEELPEARLLLDQASALIEKGKYREAIRTAFLALLACLQNRGALRYDRSRTNREYLADLAASPELAAIFRSAARPYERAWYGCLPVTGDDADRMVGICSPLVLHERPAR